MSEPTHATIDELLDRAVAAINGGDRATADALAGRVLAVDRKNHDAEELLTVPIGGGEIRRLTILFADLVDSTALSTRIELEVYRTVVGTYRDEVLRVVNNYEGHIASTKGDGLLAVFGHPIAHENDAHRAVQAGLDITRQVAALSAEVHRRFGFDIDVRVGIHRGLVYLDTNQDDVYGPGANLAARMCSLAEPGTVAVSEPVERVVSDEFECEERPAALVKGVEEPIVHYLVIGERDATTRVRGPLVGRDSELAYLRTSWAQAMAGTLATSGVVLKGEGGIGKSRLAAAAVDLAERSGTVVLGLFGSPFYTDVGLRPVRRLLERRCGIGRDSDPAEAVRKLHAEVEKRAMDPTSVTPLLALVLGLAPETTGYRPPTANAGRLYEQIAAAVKDYLLACIGSGPGLVLFEDIHWFDEDTIEVVQALLRETNGRLLIVITGRHVPPLDGTRQFDVKPLDEAQTDALILALHPEMTAKARKAVQERCDGIPLYIEEVVAKLKGQPTDFGASAQVPDTLYEALIARLRNTASSHLVVEAAALMGSRIDGSVLASVVERDQHEVGKVLAELTQNRVLKSIREGSWRFHHELMREVAAELTPPTLRRRLHHRIGDALVAAAADGTPEWPLVAHHYEEAERFDEAALAYQGASADARRRGALNEARIHLGRALDNVERLPPARARDHREVAIRLERGFLASAATGHASTEAAAEFERCLQLIGDEPGLELYATLSALWSYYATRGELDRATQLVEALKMRLEDLPDWYRAANETVFGALALFRGDFHTARATLEAAATAVDDMTSWEIEGAWFAPNDPLAGVYSFVGLLRFLQGDLTGAEAAFAQTESRCEKLGFPHGAFTLCYARSVETLTRIEAGQLDRAAELVVEVAHRGEQHGFDEWVMIAACNRASVGARMSLATGASEPETLQAHIMANSAVVDAWRAAGTKTFLACYDGVLARLLTAAGMTRDARDRVEISLRMADATGMHYYDAELLRIRAHTHEDQDARHADLRAAIELAQKQGAYAFELRSAADDFELMGEPAQAALLEAIGRFPTDQAWPELTRARALLG